MKEKVFILLVILLLLLVYHVVRGDTVQAKTVVMDDTIKVGVYEYEPYFMVDSDGNMSGYYCDFMRVLQEQYHFKYEFVIGTIQEGENRLVDGEIDIMLGLPMNAKQKEKLIYSRYRSNKEIFGLFSNHQLNLKNLYSYTDLKVGMVLEDSNSEWVLEFFEANSIQAKIIYGDDYKTLIRLLEDNKIDLMVGNKSIEKKYCLVYEFVGSDVYIAGNKRSQDVLELLDHIIADIGREKDNSLEVLYKQYFGEVSSTLNQHVFMPIVAISWVILVICIFPPIKKRRIKNKIRVRMNKNQYLLQYQPIYELRNNRVVGFEGLLRMRDKKDNLIPPYKFIPEIEKNDMLYEVSLWLIEKAIADYRIINGFSGMHVTGFYLSINLSLKELENDAFIDKAIDLLTQSNLGQDKICLEIIERFKMSDLDNITQNISRLKQAGFKLAIDDFGVEYSNLDIFQKLDVDIIKVDKSFVDGIGKDSIKEEIVIFISKLANIRKRYVVLEGIEEEHQDTKIKELEHDSMYVQGYYYNRPMHLEQIKMLFPKQSSQG